MSERIRLQVLLLFALSEEKVGVTHETAEVISLEFRRAAQRKSEIVLVTRIASTGSKPFLGTASDGHDYWCKPPNNSQGEETVIAEVAAGVIGDLIGAPIPTWTTLPISPDLRGLFIREAGYRLDGRDVFASRVIHDADIAVMDHGSLEHVTDDGNYNRIPKLFALWFLCNAEDIQFAYNPADDYSVTSIDHGFWFGSHEYPWGFGSPTELHGRPRVPTVRTPIPPKHWDKAIETLDLLDDGLAGRIRDKLPENWAVDKLLVEKIASYVLSRKDYAQTELIQLKKTKGGR